MPQSLGLLKSGPTICPIMVYLNITARQYKNSPMVKILHGLVVRLCLVQRPLHVLVNLRPFNHLFKFWNYYLLTHTGYAKGLVDNWYNEVKKGEYDYATGASGNGGVVGHFTQ